MAITDLASPWTSATRETAFNAYSTIYLIDLGHAVIGDVEATTSVQLFEMTAQRRIIDRTQERFGIWPGRFVADTAYGSAANLAWLVEDNSSESHIPVFDKSGRIRVAHPPLRADRTDFFNTIDPITDIWLSSADRQKHLSDRNHRHHLSET